MAQQPVELSIERAIQIGFENSKSLHSSLMKVQAADAKSSEVNTSRLPSLKFGGSYTRLSDVPSFQATVPAGAFGSGFPPQTVTFPLSQTITDNYNFRVTLLQPLFTGFRLQSSADVADNTARATDQEYQRDKAELVYNIKNAYWNVFKALEFKKVVDENVEQVQAHLTDVRNLMNQGMMTINDVLKVEVQFSNAKLMQIDANNSVRLAMIVLNSMIGQPLNIEIQPASKPEQPEVQSEEKVMDVNKLVRQAHDNRSEIKAMQFRKAAAEAGLTLARAGWFPQIYLTGSYYYARPNPRIIPTLDRFKDTWDISVTASFDIWNWGSTIHQTEQAQSQLAQAQDAFGQLEDAITLEVTQNFLELKKSKERIAVSGKMVSQAEENYRVTNEKFKLGLALNSDLLDAEVALLQAKTNYTQSLVDYELAQARLQKSIGQ